jgi:hypothetical protein
MDLETLNPNFLMQELVSPLPMNASPSETYGGDAPHVSLGQPTLLLPLKALELPVGHFWGVLIVDWNCRSHLLQGH